MELIICKDPRSVAHRASLWCERAIKAHHATAIYLPAGNTPLGLYQLWEESRPDYLDGLRLLQIDEVVTGPRAGLFKSYFEKNLPSYRKQIEWIGERALHADLAILGLGLNGHVGFHEPGIDSAFAHGKVELSESTRQSLNLGAKAEGLTYGIGSFIGSKAVLLIVTGASKAAILSRLLNRESGFPAAVLRDHADLTVLVDHAVLGY